MDGDERFSQEGTLNALAQLLFAGIGIGSIYALVALGLVLIYRTTNVVNFAQGDFPMVGAFILVLCLNKQHLPYGLAILIALGGMALFGVRRSSKRCSLMALLSITSVK